MWSPRKNLAHGREVLATVIAPVVLMPGPYGYSISLTLQNGTADLAAGRPLLRKSCGGAMINFLSTPHSANSALIVPIRGRIHPKSIYRGLRGALLSA